MAETYNFALEKAQGKYIAVLEGDDYWPKYKLKYQVGKMLRCPEAVLSFGECCVVTNDMKQIDYFGFRDDEGTLNNIPVGNALNAFFRFNLFIQAQTVMIRKGVLEQIGGFQFYEKIPAVDYPTWVRLSLEGRFLAIPKCLGFWRRHGLSVSLNHNTEILNGITEDNLKFIKGYREKLIRLGFEFREPEIVNFGKEKIKEVQDNYTYNNAKLYLEIKEYRKARDYFYRFFTESSMARWKFVALLGMFSSIIRINVLKCFMKNYFRLRKCLFE